MKRTPYIFILWYEQIFVLFKCIYSHNHSPISTSWHINLIFIYSFSLICCWYFSTDNEISCQTLIWFFFHFSLIRECKSTLTQSFHIIKPISLSLLLHARGLYTVITLSLICLKHDRGRVWMVERESRMGDISKFPPFFCSWVWLGRKKRRWHSSSSGIISWKFYI